MSFCKNLNKQFDAWIFQMCIHKSNSSNNKIAFYEWSICWNLVLFQFLFHPTQLKPSKHREKEWETHKRCLDEENDEYFKLWLICYLFSGGETKLGESIISFTNSNESFFNKAPFSFISNRHRICQQVCWRNISCDYFFFWKLVFVFDQTGSNWKLRKDLNH